MTKTNRIQQKSMALMPSVESLQAVRRLIACVEATSYSLLRRRILSAIAVCSIVWLASLWLGAALAQAQESPSDESGISVSQPLIAQPSIAATEPRHLVLSMIDRNELQPSALPSSPQAAESHGAAKVLLPSDSDGAEYASLAALALAPSSPLLNAIDAKSAVQTGMGSHAGDGKPLVYQLGAVNFVINGLPSSFSVSSAGTGAAGAR
ncbi:MAG TPA: hypothetical protein VGP23_12390 [Candidatus Binataceae bacterium]|jgi:hypothetical protein|nr:hypothetical protein [Candidatus Binataceae bacterium]